MLPFTLQQLRILKAVATEKSFTKAAEVLFLSQPHLSKQIKALEQNLDVSLVRRNSNSISLTENGQIFLQYAERILALCEESCRALIDLKNGERGNLSVGASQTIGTYLMPRLLALFAQNYPQINLKVQVNSTRLIAKQIVNRQIDLAVVGGEVPQELKQNLKIEHFVEDELNLIISNSHPFAKRKKIKKEDLYHLNFITLHSNSTIRKFVDNTLKQNNIDTFFCDGNTFQKNTIINKFNNNDKIKIIMLSKNCAASGANLIKTSQIIFLDPIYGSSAHVNDTENKIIGRAQRLGRINNLKIIRMIIKA